MDLQRSQGPTAAQRRAWGRRGALILHGSGKTNVAPAHAALRAKWERLADPDGNLDPEVRERRAGMLRRAEMIKLSQAAAEARSRKNRAGSVRSNEPAQPREGTRHARQSAA